MSEEWSDWIEHDGRGCPCVGMWVQAVMDSGKLREGIAGGEGGRSWTWELADKAFIARLIRYRIRKPRGLTMLEEIAKGVREPVDA
jgi:hypothetical protein